MDAISWVLVTLIGGGFLGGSAYIVMRRDKNLELTRAMHGSAVDTVVIEADWRSPRDEFERKLAIIESRQGTRHLRDRAAAERLRKEREQLEAEREAEEAERRKLEAERLAEEEERRKLEEEQRLAQEAEERERQRLEEERRLAEEAAAKAEEERLKLEAEREEAARLEEERRLAEEERQAELARLEEERLAELARLEEERQAQEAEERRAAAVDAQRLEEDAARELAERLEREGAKKGDVQVSLMWNNYNDLDLHVVCPSGERIHGGNRNSACGGELDVDANVRPDSKRPVENVVWSDGHAPGGTYKVYVHHYKKHKKRRTKDPTEFKVVVNAGGDLREYNAALTHGDPIMFVCEFTMPEVSEREAIAEAEVIRQADLAEVEEERSEEVQEVAEVAEPIEAEEVDEEAARELAERLEREGAMTGDVQISLMWNNFNDLDLHVVCPSGERIHGGNRISECGGELDVDANVKADTKRPVENVFWSSGGAPSGRYKAFVHHYKKHNKRRTKDPTEFKLVVNAGGKLTEYNGALTHGDPIMLVAEFDFENPDYSPRSVVPAMPDLSEISE